MPEQNISPEQRLENFNIMTRQCRKAVGSKSSLSENTEYSIDLPKTRLLANTYIRVQATVTATHASGTAVTPHEDAPFSLLNRVVLDMNDGFLPITLTGKALAAYNRTLFKGAPTLLASQTTGQRKMTVMGLTSSSGGTANTIDFMLQLPNTLNRRDGVGLINLQGSSQLGTIKFTIGSRADIIPDASGFTFAISAISVTIYTESFTIPKEIEARPDLGVLKQVLEKTETLIAGENTLKLPVGRGIIYRKIGLIVYNATPARVLDSTITSNMQLILNQNDVPYDIPAYTLARINAEDYGAELPAGEYVFDFATMGITNMAGHRDYLDTTDLTECWLKFTSGAGTCKVWTEQIHLATGGKATV